MMNTLIRWATGIDFDEALKREQERTGIAWKEALEVENLRRQAMAERDKALADREAARSDAHAFWTQRAAARDQVADLNAELETLRKTNAMFRSLIGILRDVNRELDERNVYLEKLHGMTPGERLDAVEKDAPDRCTKTEPPAPRTQAADRLADWERHGSHRWGLGVAHDMHNLACRVTALEGRP